MYMSAFGGKATWRLHCEMSAYDPKRTFHTRWCASTPGKFCSASLSNTAIFDTLCRDLGQPSEKEGSVYAAIRQGKAKTGMTEELTRRIKEGAIPIISDIPGFKATMWSMRQTIL
jgi:hypothetical protein